MIMEARRRWSVVLIGSVIAVAAVTTVALAASTPGIWGMGTGMMGGGMMGGGMMNGGMMQQPNMTAEQCQAMMGSGGMTADQCQAMMNGSCH
jgi:Spy/CpxP family protein refolding chaperone